MATIAVGDIHGNRLTPGQWDEYAKTAFPTEDDINSVNAVCKDPEWIAPKV